MTKKGQGWTKVIMVDGRRRGTSCQACGIKLNCKPLSTCSEPRHLKYYEKRLENGTEYKEAHPEINKRATLKSKYGMTLEEFQAMLIKQKRLCAMCGKPFGSATPFVDHNHETGEVRGLLHNRCNVILGMAEDENKLQMAINYLKRIRPLPLPSLSSP